MIFLSPQTNSEEHVARSLPSQLTMEDWIWLSFCRDCWRESRPWLNRWNISLERKIIKKTISLRPCLNKPSDDYSLWLSFRRWSRDPYGLAKVCLQMTNYGNNLVQDLTILRWRSHVSQRLKKRNTCKINRWSLRPWIKRPKMFSTDPNVSEIAPAVIYWSQE